VTLNPTARARFAEGYQVARRFAADGLALFGSLLLLALYLLPNVASPSLLVKIPNVLTTSLVIVIGSMAFVGWNVARRTPLDAIFVGWIFLAFASHIFATIVLDRQLPDVSLYGYVVFILAMWAAFRAGFAIVKISPGFGPIALCLALVFVLLLSAGLGIAQAVGPFRVQATELATKFTASEANVLEGAMNGRPTGIFGGPNLLGYANFIGALTAISFGVVYARRAKWWHILGIMSLLGVFGFGILEAQSRTWVVLFAFAVLGYGLALRRLGASHGAMATFVVLFLGVAAGGFVTFQIGKLNYVEGTLKRSIMEDESLRIRQQAYEMAANIAVDIAPLGTGVGQANQERLMYQSGYDRYWVIGVDNEWVNMYLAHGVWGPALVALFFVAGFRGVAPARRSPNPASSLVGWLATFILWAGLLVSVGGVRIAKYESGIFVTLILGAAFGSAEPTVRFPNVRLDARKAAA